MDILTTNTTTLKETKQALLKMTVTDLVAHILEGQTETETHRIPHEKTGDNAYQFSETTGADGNVLRVDETFWSYYPGDLVVDEIVTIVSDDKGNMISRRTIKHFEDGRQPVPTAEVFGVLDMSTGISTSVTPGPSQSTGLLAKLKSFFGLGV